MLEANAETVVAVEKGVRFVPDDERIAAALGKEGLLQVVQLARGAGSG